jgi:hypothetical protein
MPISNQYNTIFIHIPKCGGTSIEKILGMAGESELFAYDHIYQLKNLKVSKEKFTPEEYTLCVAKTPQHLTLRELKKIIPLEVFNSYFKFSIVRNPFSKLVSEYNYIKSLDCHSDVLEFEDLVEYLHLDSFKRIHRFDSHLETQSSFLVNENLEIDKSIKIYRFESISECMADILKIGPINYEVHARKSEIYRPYQEYYNQKMIDVVLDFYKDDFVNFNYSTELK